MRCILTCSFKVVNNNNDNDIYNNDGSNKARFQPSQVMLLGSSEERKAKLKRIKIGKGYQYALEYSREVMICSGLTHRKYTKELGQKAQQYEVPVSVAKLQKPGLS